MKSSALAYFGVAIAVSGCGAVEDGRERDGAVEVAPVKLDGTRVDADLFTAKNDVYLASLIADRPEVSRGEPLARDYYFQVVDLDGTLVSTSALACRQVRIGAHGHVEMLYGGVGCTHLTGLSSIGVTVGLTPFDDTLNLVDDIGTYEVQLVPTYGFAGFAEPALTATFQVAYAESQSTPPPMDPTAPPAPEPHDPCDDPK